jgi:hypothetical protein
MAAVAAASAMYQGYSSNQAAQQQADAMKQAAEINRRQALDAAAAQKYAAETAAAEQAAAQREAADMQQQAGVEAERVANENAARIEREGEENSRRLAEKMAEEEGVQRARAAASGAVFNPEDENGTLIKVVSETAKENERQIAWERSATTSRAAVERKGGAYAMQAALARATASRKAAEYTERVGALAETDYQRALRGIEGDYLINKKSIKNVKKGGKASLVGGFVGAGKAIGQGAYDYNANTVDPNTGQGQLETWWSGNKQPQQLGQV